MGLLAWIKRRTSTAAGTNIATTHSTSVSLGAGPETAVPDGAEASDLAQRQAAVDEIDHLAHQILAAGAAPAGSGEMNVMSSTNVVIDGQVVSADDPRAREGMLAAVSKLRAQGFDELADDLESQFGAAAPAAPADAQSAALTDALPVSPADAAEAPWSAEPVGDGGVGAPSAPTPPTPPSPPPGRSD